MINWDVISTSCNWVAKDEHGPVWAYGQKPFRQETLWDKQPTDECAYKLDIELPGDWEELHERPNPLILENIFKL